MSGLNEKIVNTKTLEEMPQDDILAIAKAYASVVDEAKQFKEVYYGEAQKVAIIGMSGRQKSMEQYLSPELYAQMTTLVSEKVKKDDILVSGGAAWADHVAVSLFNDNKVAGLELYMPCVWDADKTQFYDSGASHWATNPGRMANTCHKKFSAVLGRNTLADIGAAVAKGAVIKTYAGFHARNSKIATTCDSLVCLTFAAGDAPVGGGSADTWRKCKSPKTHISLAPYAKSKRVAESTIQIRRPKKPKTLESFFSPL